MEYDAVETHSKIQSTNFIGKLRRVPHVRSSNPPYHMLFECQPSTCTEESLAYESISSTVLEQENCSKFGEDNILLTKAPPKEVTFNASAEELAKFDKRWDHDLKVKSYNLASISNALRRRFEDVVNVFDIYTHLQEFYGVQTHPLRRVAQGAHDYKHESAGDSVHEHGVKIIGLIEKLMGLEMVILSELSTDILPIMLAYSFNGFVVNFNMNKIDDSLEKLVNILTTYDATIKKEKPVFLTDSSPGTIKGPTKEGK
ncbi:uncharacterized protein [Primulina huaijiensis]|uniref:uncharacterized protein n=1 Tax=Primulina huaijiensis TaxID=1492673 RepID=UPI003CC6F417